MSHSHAGFKPIGSYLTYSTSLLLLIVNLITIKAFVFESYNQSIGTRSPRESQSLLCMRHSDKQDKRENYNLIQFVCTVVIRLTSLT